MRNCYNYSLLILVCLFSFNAPAHSTAMHSFEARLSHSVQLVNSGSDTPITIVGLFFSGNNFIIGENIENDPENKEVNNYAFCAHTFLPYYHFDLHKKLLTNIPIHLSNTAISKNVLYSVFRI